MEFYLVIFVFDIKLMTDGSTFRPCITTPVLELYCDDDPGPDIDNIHTGTIMWNMNHNQVEDNPVKVGIIGRVIITQSVL